MALAIEAIDLRSTPSRRLPRAFHVVWLATIVSATGDGLVLVAFPLLAARYTSDPRLIAGVAVASRLPWLLCSLLAGALADRIDRRRFLTAVELGRMVAVAALALVVLTGDFVLPALYIGAFALGTFETGYSAASLGVTPLLVDDSDLSRANGHLYAGQTAGEQFLGPALGGVIFAIGAGVPFIADAISFGVSALLLSSALRTAQTRPAMTHVSLVDDTRDGVRWFRAHAGVRAVAGFIASLALCQAIVLSVLVLLCLETFHLSAAGYGVFLAVGACGNLAGGWLAARISLDARSSLAIGGMAAAVAYAIVAVAPNAYVAAIAFIVEAVAVAVGNVASVSLRQRLIPAELLGRVGNVIRMCIYGAMPIGAALGGVLAAGLGVRTAIFVAALLQAAFVAICGRRLPLSEHEANEHPASRGAEHCLVDC